MLRTANEKEVAAIVGIEPDGLPHIDVGLSLFVFILDIISRRQNFAQRFFWTRTEAGRLDKFHRKKRLLSLCPLCPLW
jgi:hypothetical protein